MLALLHGGVDVTPATPRSEPHLALARVAKLLMAESVLAMLLASNEVRVLRCSALCMCVWSWRCSVCVWSWLLCPVLSLCSFLCCAALFFTMRFLLTWHHCCHLSCFSLQKE